MKIENSEIISVFKKTKILIFCILPALLVVFLLPNIVFAQDNLGLNAASNIGLTTPAESDLRVVLVNIVRYFLGFIGIIATAVILYAGFLWMTSAGRPDQLAKAKQTLTSGVVGLIITLSAFAIVTFIVNLFEGGGGGLGRTNRPVDSAGGLGALGACAVESVYPAAGQEDVPRNTSIIVTFKKDVTEADIINAGQIVKENVHIYLSSQGDSCEWVTDHYENCDVSNLTNVSVSRIDRTFVFTPNDLMGNSNNSVEYSVRLDEAITENGTTNSIFADCSVDNMIWSFDVSNRLDLTPPQVKENGVIPVPDSTKDQRVESAAVAAVGGITVNQSPQAEIAAEFVSYTKLNDSMPNIDVTIDSNNIFDGDLRITVQNDEVTASLGDINDLPTIIMLGTANFSGRTVTFSGYFTVTADEDIEGGDEWNIKVIGKKNADNLTVGTVTYHFVPAGTEVVADDGLINTNTNINVLASNIFAKINSDTQIVTASNLSGSSFDLTADTLGLSGNSIQLRTNNSDLFTFDPMHDGADSKIIMTPNGLKDEPRNVSIRIDFNEAISPVSVSGDSADVSSVIQVRCLSYWINAGVDSSDPTDDVYAADCSGLMASGEVFDCGGGNYCVNGRFEVSNQYQTVDFISDIECGVNSCGEQIYCLPSNSHLEVWMRAASLEDCTVPGDCISKESYNTCDNGPGNGNHCNNGTNYYPYSIDMDGVLDTANNSLDANRDGVAYGPSGSDYDQNIDGGTGDNYKWNFWVSDLIDTEPPIINSISPDINESDFDLEDPLVITFSKPMQSSSLRTGQSTSRVSDKVINHKHINLWNYANRATGYWITNEINLTGGIPDTTTVYINHSLFGPLLTYRTQVGSGVRDIYQNCFRPAEDARVGVDECTGDDFTSCCNGGEDLTDRCDD